MDYHAGETRAYDCGNCRTNGQEAGGFPANFPGIPGTFALPGVQCEHCHGPGMTMAEGNPAIRKDCHVHGPEIAVKASGGLIVSKGQRSELLTGTWWNAARSGEGFLLQSGYVPGATSLTMLASFHTCDSKGNQA